MFFVKFYSIIIVGKMWWIILILFIIFMVVNISIEKVKDKGKKESRLTFLGCLCGIIILLVIIAWLINPWIGPL